MNDREYVGKTYLTETKKRRCTHDNNSTASASVDGRLIFWQLGKQKRPLPLAQAAFDTSISQLAWSPDDGMLALGTESGLVSVCTTPRV
jgi:hypothetical protein